MKYLVVKGWLGFGDRLETLKMCVKFAMDNNLQIYVDWTDSIWSHGTESFYTYFSLVGVPQLKSLDDIPEDATYYPSFWKEKIREPFSETIWKENPCETAMLGPDTLKHQEDVLVVSSIGRREVYSNSSFFGNVFRVVDPRIIQEVKKRQVEHNLRNCLGMHIRGTDRLGKKGREMPIQWMVVNASMSGGLNGKPMIAVSDDPASTEIWTRFFPQTKLMSSLSMQLSSNGGNHNIKKEDLNTTKDALNVDCLVDFFTLASCQRIMSTYSKQSRFYHEAVRLSYFVDTILSTP
jgi:hypothetical protein